jgi:hypothetical protein
MAASRAMLRESVLHPISGDLPRHGLSTTAPNEPGQSSSAPGSAFNENGGTAGGVYAGNGAPSLNGNQDKAISQYDVACYQVSQH